MRPTENPSIFLIDEFCEFDGSITTVLARVFYDAVQMERGAFVADKCEAFFARRVAPNVYVATEQVHCDFQGGYLLESSCPLRGVKLYVPTKTNKLAQR